MIEKQLKMESMDYSVDQKKALIKKLKNEIYSERRASANIDDDAYINAIRFSISAGIEDKIKRLIHPLLWDKGPINKREEKNGLNRMYRYMIFFCIKNITLAANSDVTLEEVKDILNLLEKKSK